MRTLQLLFLLLLISCDADTAVEPPVSTADSYWSIDLVRTHHGQQENYIRSIETNWSNARRLAHLRGAVRSYQAFSAPPDSARGWDVMLMTEYTDSTSWAQREDIFQEIFESDEFVAVAPARPSSEMRSFAAGAVTMRAFVTAP